MQHFPDPDSFAPLAPIHVLVVDDSASQRGLLGMVLERAGLRVEMADGPHAALARLRDDRGRIRMIVSDWQMPGMDGPDFCRAVRRLPRDGYIYMILMTSATDRDMKARGLEAGADDFVRRPLDLTELRARIQTGRRILGMQAELMARNAQTRTALDDLRAMHDAIQRDLAEARPLQRAFLPPPHTLLDGAEISLRLVTSGQVGGDLVGHFAIDKRRVGLFSIDVSGHGIASALLTGRLAGQFSWRTRDRNIAFGGPGGALLPPERVMAQLNDFMLQELRSDIYFTAILAYVDLVDGAVELCQAGHPYPLIRAADGVVRRLGQGGPPVGLLSDAVFERVTARLDAGEALLAYSDGLTECLDPDGTMLEEDGLANILAVAPDGSEAAVEHVTTGLRTHADDRPFDDDISMLILRRAD